MHIYMYVYMCNALEEDHIVLNLGYLLNKTIEREKKNQLNKIVKYIQPTQPKE